MLALLTSLLIIDQNGIVINDEAKGIQPVDHVVWQNKSNLRLALCHYDQIKTTNSKQTQPE